MPCQRWTSISTGNGVSIWANDRQRAERRKHGQGNWKLIRYADDFVLMVSGDRHHAEALREEVAAVLAPLGLHLAPEKTRVVHIDEGFVFLGHLIRRQRKRGTQKHYVYTKPSRKAIASIKDKVKAKTYRSTRHMDLDEMITRLNQVTGGVGELLPARSVQGRVQRSRPPRMGPADALDTRQVRGQAPARDERTPPPLLRPGVAVRLQRGRVHRRLQRHSETLPLPRQQHPDPVDPETGSRHPAADQRVRHAERPLR